MQEQGHYGSSKVSICYLGVGLVRGVTLPAASAGGLFDWTMVFPLHIVVVEILAQDQWHWKCADAAAASSLMIWQDCFNHPRAVRSGSMIVKLHVAFRSNRALVPADDSCSGIHESANGLHSPMSLD